MGDVRKDGRLVPLNSDFDLYSSGRNGRSVGPLNSALSQDDVVRASNGAFINLARKY
jgi:general secretion pathway protein G